jgi:two-component system, NarL family, response regulator NreC
MKTYKVIVCDDHAVVRAGLRLILDKEKDFQIVGEAENAKQAIEKAALHKPDLVLMDISMPGAKGWEAIPQMRVVAPQARVIILTVHDDKAYFFQALQAGAAGYVLKGASVSEVLAALRLVTQGGVPIPSSLAPGLLNDYLERVVEQAVSSYDMLSSREREILRLICKGRTNKQIAEELFLSVRTVERHRTSIMRKVGLENRAELVAYAVRQGFLHEGDMQ